MASKKAQKASFAVAVREAMTTHNAKYRFVETTGGSGPLVSFERPHAAKAKVGRLREVVTFQKGLHGADWFRVNLFPTFEAGGATGTIDHTLWAGQTLDKDVSWETSDQLATALNAAAKSLEAKAKKFFTPFERETSRLDALFGRLVEHYARWLKEEGSTLSMDRFKDDDAGKLPAFVAFTDWLEKKKLTQGLKGDVDGCLWRFWHSGRPMREIDYDPNDYYDCTECSAFVRRARATLKRRKVPGFGVHHALVCNKH